MTVLAVAAGVSVIYPDELIVWAVLARTQPR